MASDLLSGLDQTISTPPESGVDASDVDLAKRWYAVFALPQHEKTIVRNLALRQIETFLPTYESVRIWKNRQRVRLQLPLFPTYLFVHICKRERVPVLSSPGVIRIVGNGREPLPISDQVVEFLRAHQSRNLVEPYREMVVGRKVRIRSGAMQGLEGVLVRKNNTLRFVLRIDLINQNAAVEIEADNLEPVLD